MRYALFVSFFPQLVAGPIERSENLLRQVNEDHPLDEKAVRDGLLVMLLGFFEKLVIADRASLYVDAVYGNWQQASGLQILLATVAFAFQIYGDFGGYSHIAIGAAKVLGYDLMENFRQPYFAVSVRDFWRRWHISLSTWFRDYVYIPLGGSRVGAFRRALNVMVTFTISGLWHGAAMNYVAWGAANGALQVAESFLPRRFNEPRGRLGRCAKALLTFIVIDATWLLFRAHALSTALHMAERMVRCAAGAPMATGFTFPQALVLVVGLTALGALDALHERGRTLTAWLDRRPAALRMALMLLGVLLVVIFGVWGTNYDAQAFYLFPILTREAANEKEILSVCAGVGAVPAGAEPRHAPRGQRKEIRRVLRRKAAHRRLLSGDEPRHGRGVSHRAVRPGGDNRLQSGEPG